PADPGRDGKGRGHLQVQEAQEGHRPPAHRAAQPPAGQEGVRKPMAVKTAKKAASKAKKPAKADAPAAEVESKTGTKIGGVDTDKGDKPGKVVVAYLAKHPKYGKYTRQRTVLHVHDEQNESKSGDVVEVAPCRPISKTKSWKLVRIVERRAELAAALKS